jgi:hypothetical protein
MINATSDQRFRATIEGTEKGRVFVVLPFDVEATWGKRERYDVKGTVNGMRIRNTLQKFGRGYFLPMGPAWRRCNGVGPGDVVEVALWVDVSQREGLAPDIAAALEDSPEAGRFFDTLAGFYRKGYIRWIDATTRRPDVRAERITELIKLLEAGHKQRPH